MSRSTKKPIVKDRPRNYKKSSVYWRKIRRKQKQQTERIKTQEEIEISQPKEIVNDYDYSDYVFYNCDDKCKRK